MDTAYITIRFDIPAKLAHRTEHITDRILEKLDGFLSRNDICVEVEETYVPLPIDGDEVE